MRREINRYPRYLDRDMIGSDGNFHQGSKVRGKKTDPDDMPLNAGQGYCADQKKVDEHLRKMKDDAPVWTVLIPSSCSKSDADGQPRTCVGFKAGDTTKATKFKNYTITGVVMCMCIRHSNVRGGSIVDLTKGER